MRWLLMKFVSFWKVSYGMKRYVSSVPGEAKGTAAALRLKKVRPIAATERQSMMSMGRV